MQSWSDGPTLPNPLNDAATVQYGSTFLLVGGQTGDTAYSDAILMYDDGSWQELQATLSSPRELVQATMVDASSFPHC